MRLHSALVMAIEIMIAMPACSQSGGSPGPTANTSGTALVPVAPATPTPDEADPTPDEPTAADVPATPVDLLRSVRTELAVSTAYHDESSQAAHLVDGDLETAWNSRTGDLVGAWIEARIPSTATVTSIALTAGFTKQGAGTDLFTGNHRVARVRVLRDGVEVAVLPLDPESRELQTLDVTGPGGVYRVEVAEVLPGSRTAWRETCVSELRIFGRDASAREGARLPHFGVGHLPDPRPAPGSHDRAEVAGRLRTDVRSLVRSWKQFEHDIQNIDENTGDPSGEPEERAGLARSRRAMLSRIADLVELVDDAQSDAIRSAAQSSVDWGEWDDREATPRADLVLTSAAIGAVVTWLADDETRCEWAKAEVAIRLGRLATRLETRRYFDEVNESQEGLDREQRRLAIAVERAATRFASVERSWAGNPASAAPRIRDLELPALPELTADWDVVRAQLEVAQTACSFAP